MPIHPDLRPLYPSNWRELADGVKFERAKGRCERCGRPHGEPVWVFKYGGWIDPNTGKRYDGQGRPADVLETAEWPEGRFVKTVLTCAHLDQNPANNDQTNLAALCQRCHLQHDREHHRRRAYQNRRRPWAVADLFETEEPQHD